MIAQIARQREQLQRRRQVDVRRVHPLQQRRILRLLFFIIRVAALHIGTEPARLQIHRLVRFRIHAKRLVAQLRLIEQLQRRIERHFIRRSFFLQRRGPLALLNERRIAAHAHVNRIAVLRRADPNAADLAGVDRFGFVLQLRLEAGHAVAEVKARQVIDVFLLAAADRVEVVFHLGRELVVDQARPDAAPAVAPPRTPPKSAPARRPS